MIRTRILSLALVFLVGPSARAVEVEVTGLDGRIVRGRVVVLVPEIVLASAAEEVVLAWSEVLAIRPLDVETATAGTEPDAPLHFELTDGSAFGGRIIESTAGGFVVALAAGQRCRLEPSALRTVRAAAAGAAARGELAEISAEADRSEDVVVVERGHKVAVLRGAVRQIGPDRVICAWKGRELTLPWEHVAGVSFARPLPERSDCTVHLRDGNVFAGRVVGGDATVVTIRSSFFEHLELPWARIGWIECRSGRLTYLSDLVPVRYEFTPFFQKQWDYARDATLTGHPIRLGGHRYAKGLTMHSRSLLVYRLDGKYRQFAATVGIADEMETRGDVTLAVLGDGRVLWRAANVRGGEPPRAVLVDISGVQELSLHVDFGDGLDLSDHACWAAARVIR